MTPAAAIASLDRSIERNGQTILLRKQGGAPADDKPVLAFVRGYKPEELSGGIQQGDTNVILSPAGLSASGFAGMVRRLDKITIDGRLRSIEVANPVEIGGQVVRIELWVRG